MEQEKEGNLRKEVEAILFAAGRKVELDEILKHTGENDPKKVEDTLKELKGDYEASDSPMFVIQEGTGWKMTVKEKYLGVVKDVAPHTELNKALLETLAIIAWKQPIFQADVIKVRGGSAYEHIRDLVDMGFITKIKHGRSFILKPSTRFFDYFDLPTKEAVKEVFKDIELADTEKRRELGENVEEQQKIGDQEERLGNLELYEEHGNQEDAQEINKAEEELETEKLGGLEVFEEKEEEETTEEPKETEQEESELKTEEEKTKHIVEELMHERKKPSYIEEETEDNTSEESSDNPKEEEKTKERRKLSKELEEFAGLDKEDKEEKTEENSEDNSGKQEE
ncbi:MAG: SMC-Scp complex subunit ScpB [Nanoarchaeota archaeon]|nr:SMC-Scp complex subunit ScpB [Nanoarchaeota archaeon]